MNRDDVNLASTFRREEMAMSLQVQLVQTNDATSLPVQAFIMPIVSWEDYTSPAHELLRARTDGYFHELLGNLMRHGLHADLPVILLKDDRAERSSQLEYVAFTFVDEYLDQPYVAYQQALRILADEGVYSMALAISMATAVTEEYDTHLAGLKFALNTHRLMTLQYHSQRLLLAVDCDKAMQLAMQRLAYLQCANTRGSAANS